MSAPEVTAAEARQVVQRSALVNELERWDSDGRGSWLTDSALFLLLGVGREPRERRAEWRAALNQLVVSGDVEQRNHQGYLMYRIRRSS